MTASLTSIAWQPGRSSTWLRSSARNTTSRMTLTWATRLIWVTKLMTSWVKGYLPRLTRKKLRSLMKPTLRPPVLPKDLGSNISSMLLGISSLPLRKLMFASFVGAPNIPTMNVKTPKGLTSRRLSMQSEQHLRVKVQAPTLIWSRRAKRKEMVQAKRTNPKVQPNLIKPELVSTIGTMTVVWCPRSETWMRQEDSALMAATLSMKGHKHATTLTTWFVTPSCVEEVTSGKSQTSLRPTPTRTPASQCTGESKHRWTASWKSFPTRAVIFSTTNFTAVLNMESIIDSGNRTGSQATKMKWALPWIASLGIKSERLPNLRA